MGKRDRQKGWGVSCPGLGRMNRACGFSTELACAWVLEKALVKPPGELQTVLLEKEFEEKAGEAART